MLILLLVRCCWENFNAYNWQGSLIRYCLHSGIRCVGPWLWTSLALWQHLHPCLPQPLSTSRLIGKAMLAIFPSSGTHRPVTAWLDDLCHGCSPRQLNGHLEGTLLGLCKWLLFFGIRLRKSYPNEIIWVLPSVYV